MVTRFVAAGLFIVAGPLAFAAKPGLQVFVSIVPLKFFVQNVGGKDVTVNTMVRPGDSPATFEPTPRQMEAISAADIYYRIGVPFEAAWMSRLQKINPEMKVIDLREAIDGSVGEDPHIWLDPVLAQAMVTKIAESLSQLRPGLKKQFQGRAGKLTKRLEKLDSYIRKRLKNRPSREFLVYHGAWEHFARRYGLKQIAVEPPGREPGPRDVKNFIKQARQKGFNTLYIQKQVSSKQAGTIAKEIGASTVVVDPLAFDYIFNLKALTNLLAAESQDE